MKLLYCELCGDIVAPLPEARAVRECRCASHKVWWEAPGRGILRVCYNVGHPEVMKARGGGPGGGAKAWILGITNLLLHHPSSGTPDAETVQQLIDAHEDSYIFKKTRSLIIRIRPGQSSDTAWALPPGMA